MSVAKNISVAKKIFVTPKGQARSMSAKVPDPVDKHVGSRLRMRRRMLRMTQRKLGHKLGLTFQQVHKYETGQNGLSVCRLQELSRLLQVPVPQCQRRSAAWRRFGNANQASDQCGSRAGAADSEALATAATARSRTSATACRCPTTASSARSGASATATCAAATATRGTGRQAEVPAWSTLLRSVAPSYRCLRPRSKLLRYVCGSAAPRPTLGTGLNVNVRHSLATFVAAGRQANFGPKWRRTISIAV